ncbi:MAG: autotransporter-associated beta strand repeat-containing protein [Opitutaceae bacterium]|jgi:autotransporter-associated beta strand protein
MNTQRIRLPLLAATLLTGVSTLPAADVTWVGNTSNLWNVGANWSTGAIPTSGSTLVFGAPGSSGVALSDNITSLTVGGTNTDGIVFDSTAAGYTITKTGTLTLASSGTGIGIKDTSLFAQSIANPSFSSNQTVQVGDTTGAALSTLTIQAGFSGGTSRFTKTGTGLLAFGGSGSTLGGLTVNQGTVGVGNDGQIGTVPTGTTATVGWIVLNGGTLRVQANTGGSWEINANRGIALGDNTAGSGGTLNLYTTNAAVNAVSVTYNGIIANYGTAANSLTKTGIEILSLGGPNTYTGATKLNQGQMTLDFTAATAPTSNIISNSSTLVMGDMPTSLSNTTSGSPILLVQGSNTAATSQTFDGTAIHAGNASFMARGGTSTYNTTLSLGALTHSAGGTVGFSTMTNTSSGKGVITTTTTNTNGILGGWATTAASVGTGTVPLTQTDWAANDGSGNIVAYAGYTIATSTLANNAANNVRIDSTSSGNITPTFTANVSDLNTIQVTDTTATRTIAVGSGKTLRFGAFGAIWNSSNKALTVGVDTATGGTLTAGGATDTAGEIVFNTVAAITVNSAIGDNGSGVVNLVKTGSSNLILNAANTYTGGTVINQGTIGAKVAGAFGGSGQTVTVMTGATASLTGTGLTYANNFNLAGSVALTPGTNTVSGTVTLLGDTTIGSSGAGSATFTGKITGDYNLSFIGTSNTLSNTANDFGGNLGINGSGASAISTSAVTVKLGASNVISNGAGKGNVYITGGTAGSTLDMNGQTETINGLVSGGTVAQSRITNTNAATATLTLGDNDQTATYAGTILDGTGKVAITKIGAGVQTFGGANTYTGNTTISNGTLALSSTGSIGGSAIVSVASGATFNVSAVSGYAVASGQTLRGAGSVIGAVAAGSGATVAGGVDASTLGTLTFSGTLDVTAATVSLKLNSTAGTSDLLVANGLTLGGATLSLSELVSGTWAGASTFTLVDNTSLTSVSGTFAGYVEGATVTVGSNNFTISYLGGTGNDITLSVAAIPEPSTYAFAAGLVTLGLVMVRRRRAGKASV